MGKVGQARESSCITGELSRLKVVGAAKVWRAKLPHHLIIPLIGTGY